MICPKAELLMQNMAAYAKVRYSTLLVLFSTMWLPGLMHAQPAQMQQMAQLAQNLVFS